MTSLNPKPRKCCEVTKVISSTHENFAILKIVDFEES